MPRVYVIAGVLLFVVAVGFIGRADYEYAQQTHQRYCDMVEMYQKTDGQSGWPAYKGEC